MPATTSQTHTAHKTRNTAIALKAAPERDVSATATIVAKGDGALAEQILELAFATGVKVREDADLVEVLNAVDVDCEIPLHALAAVSEILTYVYRANGDAGAPDATHEPFSAATPDPEPEG